MNNSQYNQGGFVAGHGNTVSQQPSAMNPNVLTTAQAIQNIAAQQARLPQNYDHLLSAIVQPPTAPSTSRANATRGGQQSFYSNPSSSTSVQHTSIPRDSNTQNTQRSSSSLTLPTVIVPSTAATTPVAPPSSNRYIQPFAPNILQRSTATTRPSAASASSAGAVSAAAVRPHGQTWPTAGPQQQQQAIQPICIVPEGRAPHEKPGFRSK